MGKQSLHGCERKKKLRSTERELTTPLFLLRCMEVGISIPDLDLLTIGLVMDIWTEKGNDGTYSKKPVYVANQADFDRF